MIGMVLQYFDAERALSVFPFVFSGVGVYELFKVYWEKKKWINDRLGSRIIGKRIELEFTDEYIIHSGPFANGKITWDGLRSVLATNKGLIIKPENGVVIYLPRTIFQSQKDIEYILAKASITTQNKT